MVSKITHFGIRNFLTIRQAILEFDDTNIINIVGYNDGGKSAITRAIEVLFYDNYTNDQVKCIHDGETSFEIFALFDDGVRIEKVKYDNGASVWTMTKGKEVLYTNKRQNGVLSVNGVPDPIKKYLGVIKEEETKQYLNVRRNTDKLFLVGTTGSENYKMITKVLNIEVLNEAVKMINADRNTLMNHVNSMYSTINVLKRELSSIELTQDHAVEKLEDLVGKVENVKEKESLLSYAKEQLTILNDIVIPTELPTVDLGLVTLLDNMRKDHKDIQEVVYNQVPIIDTSILSALDNTKQYLSDMQIAIPPEVPTVNTAVVDLLEKIKEDIATLSTPIPTELKKINLDDITLLEQTRQYLTEIMKPIQPEVEKISDVLVNKLTLLEQTRDTLIEYNNATNHFNTIHEEYTKAMNRVKEVAEQESIVICKNCGLLAV